MALRAILRSLCIPRQLQQRGRQHWPSNFQCTVAWLHREKIVPLTGHPGHCRHYAAKVVNTAAVDTGTERGKIRNGKRTTVARPAGLTRMKEERHPFRAVQHAPGVQGVDTA